VSHWCPVALNFVARNRCCARSDGNAGRRLIARRGAITNRRTITMARCACGALHQREAGTRPDAQSARAAVAQRGRRLGRLNEGWDEWSDRAARSCGRMSSPSWPHRLARRGATTAAIGGNRAETPRLPRRNGREERPPPWGTARRRDPTQPFAAKRDGSHLAGVPFELPPL